MHFSGSQQQVAAEVTSVVSDYVRPHPWDSPGKNAGVGCHFLLHSSRLIMLKKKKIEYLFVYFKVFP